MSDFLKTLLAQKTTKNAATSFLVWEVAEAVLLWISQNFEAPGVYLKSNVNPKNGTAHYGAVDGTMPAGNKQFVFMSETTEGKRTASIKPAAMSDTLKEFFRADFGTTVEEFAKANAPTPVTPATVKTETTAKKANKKAETAPTAAAPTITKKAETAPTAAAPTAAAPIATKPAKTGKRVLTK